MIKNNFLLFSCKYSELLDELLDRLQGLQIIFVVSVKEKTMIDISLQIYWRFTPSIYFVLIFKKIIFKCTKIYQNNSEKLEIRC